MVALAAGPGLPRGPAAVRAVLVGRLARRGADGRGLVGHASERDRAVGVGYRRPVTPAEGPWVTM